MCLTNIHTRLKHYYAIPNFGGTYYYICNTLLHVFVYPCKYIKKKSSVTYNSDNRH